MNLFDAVFLGIIQGLTEFLPISSSGHLVIAQHFLGIDIPGNAFEVVVHLGTLFSVLVVFWGDIYHLLGSLMDKKTQKYIIMLIMATIPAVVVGIFFKESIESAFDSVRIVAGALLFTGIILIFTRWTAPGNGELNRWKGILIGLSQALAIIPGISRSGATISTGLYLGISAKSAAKFSFLLAIPAIAGAAILTSLDLMKSNETLFSFPVLAAGLGTSFIVGWLSLKWLLALLQSGKFHWFGVYCVLVGIVTLLR